MDAQPLPPSPAATCSTTWSTNDATATSEDGCGWGNTPRGGPSPPRPWERRSARGARAGQAGGSTLTVLRPRLVPKVTAPSVRANSVSSPPRPTPSPGWKWVPRWRTMISPVPTIWPPKRLTPRRWALESRPLRVEDAPFLCAMRAAYLVLGPGARGSNDSGKCGPSGLDGGDPDAGQLLPVTLALLVPGLVLELDDGDLRALLGRDHLGGHPSRRERGGVAGDGAAVHEQQGGQLERVAGLTADLVDDDDVADGNLLLTAASADDRVHVKLALLSIGVAVLGAATTHPAHDGSRRVVHGEARAERTDPSGYGSGGAGIKPGAAGAPADSGRVRSCPGVCSGRRGLDARGSAGGLAGGQHGLGRAGR